MRLYIFPTNDYVYGGINLGDRSSNSLGTGTYGSALPNVFDGHHPHIHWAGASSHPVCSAV